EEPRVARRLEGWATTRLRPPFETRTACAPQGEVFSLLGSETMRWKAFAFASALIAAAVFRLPASAESWPGKPIKIVVPYQAGQGTDVGARLIAEHLGKVLGQQVYVDNKPGAGGNIGTADAARSPSDGYTLLMGTNATQTMNEFLYPSVGYDA